MRIAIVGRSEILYETAFRLREVGHVIACILTAKEAPEYTRTAADFRALARTWQVPFSEGARIDLHTDLLRRSKADIAVSINYTGIVPQSVIDLFPLGVLNAHGGDLPRYRGNACQAWAILNGEERVGLCIHRMIGGEVDLGDIIARGYFSLDNRTKVTQIWDWMVDQTPGLMIEAVRRLSTDPGYILERQNDDPEYALRCYPRRPEDGRINWNTNALAVLRLVNASNKPYPGAFCELEGEKVVVWDAELAEDRGGFCAVPGQVTRIGDGFVDVACAIGQLRLLNIECRDQTAAPSVFISSIRTRFS